MHWHATDKKDNKALRRLAVVLLTLASIAESVALRSRPVCAVVLWLLCRAEARASGFACKTGAGAALAVPSTGSAICWLGGSGEAAHLAQRFRALAAGFFALARRAARGFRPVRRNGCVSRLANFETVMRAGPCSGSRHRSCIDTS
jgi:hypothetical protein